MSQTARKRRPMCRLLLLLALVFVVIGALTMLYTETLVAPVQGQVCCATPRDWGYAYESITLTSADGVRLAGWYIPGHNRAAVILLHGYGGNRLGVAFQAQALAKAGYGVLLYDQRASGESGGSLRSYGWLDVPDVVAAAGWLQARPDVDPERLGVFGVSTGGQIALRATAATPLLRAVVADGPSITTAQDAPAAATWGEWLSDYPLMWLADVGLMVRLQRLAPPGVREVIGTIGPRPVLLIATGAAPNDQELRKVRAYEALAGEPKQLWEIPEAEHGGGPGVRPEEYATRLVRFFDDALRVRQGQHN